MRISARLWCASAIMATVLGGAAVAQPPDRGDRDGQDRPGRGRFADGEGRRGGPGPEQLRQMMRSMPVLNALDADSDGTISTAEIDNAVAALRALDKNKDGALTIEEIRPDFAAMGGRGPGGPGGPEGRPGGPEGRSGQFMAQMFETRDADGDGKLSGDEIPEQMTERLDRIDTDGDGAISKAELQTMMSRMQQRDGDGEGRRPGRPGGERPQRPDSDE